MHINNIHDKFFKELYKLFGSIKYLNGITNSKQRDKR